MSQLTEFLISVFAIILLLEGLCRMVSAPYHPLQASLHWGTRGIGRLAAWLVRSAIILLVEGVRMLARAIWDGIESARGRRRPSARRGQCRPPPRPRPRP